MNFGYKKKTCLVLARKTGLGNQIQFIPMLRELQSEYTVITDCQIYKDFGICEKKLSRFPSVIYEVYGHSFTNHVKNRLKYPFASFYGFCHYLFNGTLKVNFGMKRYVDPGPKSSIQGTRHEFSDLNQELVPTKKPFVLGGHDPVENRIAILTSEKEVKMYMRWDEVIDLLVNEYNFKDVRVYGDSEHLPGYVETPTLLDFYEELRRCAYFFSTDSGGMHLADILGIPGTVIFGRTSSKKNHPVNKNIECIDFSTYSPELIVKHLVGCKKKG
jgi:hypothetical protein